MHNATFVRAKALPTAWELTRSLKVFKIDDFYPYEVQ